MQRMSITDRVIDTEALRSALADVRAGGFVAFEGWVRNHNEGREVRALEYEVHVPLAVSEGERIIRAVSDEIPILAALAVHRQGPLALEDCAVWVGVVSAHRDEAFRACRAIIDRIKTDLPIWKKEHYVDGDSGWVNCERCAGHAAHHSG